MTFPRHALAVIVFLIGAAWAPAAAQHPPRRVILFISDGTGVGAWTADHETGGLSVVADSTGACAATYAEQGHTAAMVSLFARGPGASRSAGSVH